MRRKQIDFNLIYLTLYGLILNEIKLINPTVVNTNSFFYSLAIFSFVG